MMAISLKFQIKEVEGLFYPCSENKGADQLAVTAKMICVFVFAYSKIWYSHNEAHICYSNINITKYILQIIIKTIE